MIRYNTKDIVKKARQLADIENTDFISYNENVTLLNDAYSDLYQKCINLGDNLYVKECILEKNVGTENAYKLPCDFFQLYAVKEYSGNIEYPIPRKSKNEITQNRSYEIKNDCIIIYGGIHNNVKIEYFPTPETLFIKRDDITLDEYEGTKIGYNKNILVAIDSNSIIHAYDLTSGDEVNSWDLQEGEELKTIEVNQIETGINGLIVFFTSNGEKKVLNSAWDETGTILADDDSKSILRYSEDNSVFLEDKDLHNNALYVVKSDGREVYIEGTTLHDILDGKELFTLDISNLEKPQLKYFDGEVVYILSKGKVYTYCNGEIFIEKDLKSEKILDIGDINLNTGLGYLVKKLGRGTFITSCFESTVLDYPDNFYFNYLSYMLAIQYKIKQNADFSALSISAENALSQYYDSIKRDSNEYVRISNIY